MSLRIGFDMDGVLADFASAYRAVEDRLFGPTAEHTRPGDRAEGARAEEAKSEGAEGAKSEGADDAKAVAVQNRRRRDAIWRAIASTPDFWTSLEPMQEGAVRRIHELALRHKWEVFFITQRPATDGDTVQRQTQRWLVAEGFDLPSVLAIAGSRGAAAGGLRLDYHVDDSAQNCIDIKSESTAKPLLIVEPDDLVTIGNARRLGIGTARSIAECLAILEEATLKRAHPHLLEKLAQLVGWR
jgi:hypothetical protein